MNTFTGTTSSFSRTASGKVTGVAVVRQRVFTDIALGGLNYQIKRHPFPSMPSLHPRRVQTIVRRYREDSA